jgi:hypothetical protein
VRSDRQLRFDDGLQSEGLDVPERELTQGVSFSGSERNRLFVNLDAEGFLDLSGVSGLDDSADGRSFAWLDFDRDGWQDLVVVNANAPLTQLFRNRLGDLGGPGRVIAVEVEGANRADQSTPGSSNRDGIGARVEARVGDRLLVREFRAGEGFAAQNSATLLVGIGTEDAAEQVTLHWPSGRSQRANQVPAGSRVRFEEPGPQSEGRIEISPYATSQARLQARAPAPPTTRALNQLQQQRPPARLRVWTTMASWCAACKRELTQLATLRDAFPNGEIDLVGVPIDPDDSAADLNFWRRKQRPAYELLGPLSPEARQEVNDWVAGRLKASALPASLVTNAEGGVLLTRFGVPTVSELRRLLDELEPPRG